MLNITQKLLVAMLFLVVCALAGLSVRLHTLIEKERDLQETLYLAIYYDQLNTPTFCYGDLR